MTCEDYCLGYEFSSDNIPKFCRSTLIYYVDSSSNRAREYGTLQFPFKDLLYPIREIYNFNEQIIKSEEITIFVRFNHLIYIR